MSFVGIGDAVGHQGGIRRDGRRTGLDGHRHESSSPPEVARDETVRRISRLDHQSKRIEQVLRWSKYIIYMEKIS